MKNKKLMISVHVCAAEQTCMPAFMKIFINIAHIYKDPHSYKHAYTYTNRRYSSTYAYTCNYTHRHTPFSPLTDNIQMKNRAL